MATFHISGTLQYPTPEAALASYTWLAAWRTEHTLEITSWSLALHSGDVQDDGQGCNDEVDFTFHFDTDVADAHNTYSMEISAAVYAGTAAPFSVADCNSEFS